MNNPFFIFIKLEEVIKKILKKVVIKFRERQFKSSSYWEDRYKKGANSGCGSYSQLAEFKADIINDFVEKNQINSVIEFGSGDGNQLKFMNYPNFIGFDVSETIVEKCRKIFNADKTKSFFTLNDFKGQNAELTLSLDVIYHLVEYDVYNDYMEKLFDSSLEFVIVYSSNDDNHPNNDKSIHVKHRNFTNWVVENRPNFKMIKHIPNKYPYNGVNKVSSYADFYFFQMDAK